MCDPGTLFAASLAVSGASSAASLAGQSAQAKAQGQYQAELTKANNASATLQLSNLRIQQAQTRESAARESQKAKLANQRARATAVVAAGEAGVAGNSVDALLHEYSAQLGTYKEAATRQTQVQDAAFEDQALAIVAGARSQNLNINAPIAQPQYGLEALRFGTNALGAYRDYNPNAFKKAS